MRKYFKNDLLSPMQIIDILDEHVRNNNSICISRLSDAELGVIYQGYTEPHEYNWWNRYCEVSGVSLPNLEAKNRLIDALKQVDIMGIFVANPDKVEPYFSLHNAMYRDTQRFFDEYNIYPSQVFYCFDHFKFPAISKFVQLIKDYPPLLIGNTVDGFAQLLKDKLNIDVAGIVRCKDIFDVDNAIQQAKQTSARWCLVSAGTPAKIICAELSKKYGKTTLDFGNVVNKIISGEYDYCYLTTNL
jgi:hypothetical protein